MNSKFAASVFLTMVVFTALVMVTAGTFFMLTYREAILDFEEAMGEMSSNTILLDRHGNAFQTLRGVESRLNIPYQQISRVLQLSILAAEDARFFQHRGVDVRRLISALVTNLVSASYREGASTITQQLVKLTLLSPEKTLFRKFREMAIALSLEMKFSKQKILLHYLNTVYLAHGNFGVEQASLAYFEKNAINITLSEAAFLAALLKKPEYYLRVPDSLSANSKYYPESSLQSAIQRQHSILQRMRQLNWISEQELNQALGEKMNVRLPRHSSGSGSYFVQHVFHLLKKNHQLENIYGGGYRIQTTFSPDLQKKMETVISSKWPHSIQEKPQVAMLSLNPKNGQVLALVGGHDFSESQFNRATQAKRQPGSAFKPFVYATALEKGFTPQSVLSDHPLYYEWENEEGDLEMYAPGNYDGKYGKERDFSNSKGQTYQTDQMTLAKALEQSINTIAVQLLDSVSIKSLKTFLKQLEIDLGSRSGLCLALGCSEVNLLQLTAAYTPFLNQGVFAPPVFILQIEDKNGRVLYRHSEKKDRDVPAVMSAWNAHQMQHMLKGVVKRGSGRAANWTNAPQTIGGKTGTSSQSKDAWFIGYLPHLITGVWIGHDQAKAMPGEQGGRTPARLWKNYMRTIPPVSADNKSQVENPLIPLKTCTISGKMATPFCPESIISDFRLEDPEPEICDLHPNPTPMSQEKSKFTQRLRQSFPTN